MTDTPSPQDAPRSVSTARETWLAIKAAKVATANAPDRDGTRLIGWRVPADFAGLSDGLIMLEQIETLLDSASPVQRDGDVVDALREERDDAVAQLNAWFDRRALAHDHLDGAVLDAAKGFLRTSRAGGMPADLSDKVEAVISEMTRLSVFADLFARAALDHLEAPAAMGGEAKGWRLGVGASAQVAETFIGEEGKSVQDIVAAIRELAPLPAASPDAGLVVDVQRMNTSRGPDFFVRIQCGDRSVTPYVFRERFKAEYEAAHFQWVFGLREDKPDLLAYDETTYPNDALARASSREESRNG